MQFIVGITCIAYAATFRANGLTTPKSDLYKKVMEEQNASLLRIPIEGGTTHEALRIHQRLSITNIYQIDMNQQTIDLSVLITLQWKNPHIKWNHTLYGLKYLNIDPAKIWQPRLAISESNTPAVLQATSLQGNALLFHDGNTRIVFSNKVQIGCKMTSCLFPIDYQICNLTLLLVSHNISEAVFAKSDSYGYNEVSHDLWQVVVSSQVLSLSNVLQNPDNWQSSQMSMKLMLARKPLYIYVNVAIPMALICAITMAAVILPRESGEKISLLITCFLSQIVYLDVLMNMFPKTSNYVPVITGYTTSVLIFTAAHIAIACLTAYLSKQALEEEIDSSLKRIYVKIIGARRFFSKRSKHGIDVKPFDQPKVDGEENSSYTTENIEEEGQDSVEAKGDNQKKTSGRNEGSEDKKYRELCIRLSGIIEGFSHFLSFFLLVVVPLAFALMLMRKIPNFCGDG